MKTLFTKWLSALLIVCLLLAPMALAEDIVVEETIPEEETAPEVEAAPEVEIILEAVDEDVASEEIDFFQEDEEVPEEVEMDLTDLAEGLPIGTITSDVSPLIGPTGSVSIPINATYFPDAAFRNYISNLSTWTSDSGGSSVASYVAPGEEVSGRTYHKFGADEVLSPEEIQCTFSMRLHSNYPDSSGNYVPYGISSVKGIEYFTHLSSFESIGNPLTEVVFGQLPNMDFVVISSTVLRRVDVSKCPNLRFFTAEGGYNAPCPMSSLDLSANTLLESVNVEFCSLTELKLGNLSKLEWLDCRNNRLTTLNISGCPKLVDVVETGKYSTLVGEEACNYSKEVDSGGSLPDMIDLWCDINVELILPNGKVVRNPGATSGTSSSSGSSSSGSSGGSSGTSNPFGTTAEIRAKNKKATIIGVRGTTCQLDMCGLVGSGFKSSKKKVATVSKTGLITVMGAGKTKITYKLGKKKHTLKLTVKDPTIPTSVALNMAGLNVVKKGDTVNLTPIIPDGTNSGFKWKSSNKKVASVKNGVVTFKKKGKVTITCTATRGKKKAKVKFKVSN